ncbi:MAG: MmgE/PrpD family protein [Streptosporangiales bacterium]|nr:MmgE/PrpD family protein [Streptosporangiales bacterium]
MSGTQSTQSSEQAAWVHRAAQTPLPEDVARFVRDSVRDTVGCIVAGAGEAASRSALRLTAGTGDELPARAEDVALLLGTAAHAHDYDDVQLPTLVHPSCVIVPTALAAARATGDGARLAAAIAAGQETSLRVGTALLTADGSNSMLFERGFHPTPVCTTLGAAVTAGVLIDLSADELGHAVGIAASLASGVLEANRTGGTVKPFHAGWAAASGIRAAYAAQCGLTAPPTVFEGRFGMLNAFGAPELAARPLGDPYADGWQVLSVSTKPYPTNAFTHAPIELALQLRDQGARAEELDRLVVGVARQVLPTIAEPRAAKVRPDTPYHARFSGPMTVALALRGGAGLGLALSDFPPDLLADETLLALADRVHVEADDWASGRFPEQLIATGTYTDRSGRQLRASVETVRGAPQRPLSEDELRAKFAANVTGPLTDDAVKQLDDLLAGDVGSAAADVVAAMFVAFGGGR